MRHWDWADRGAGIRGRPSGDPTRHNGRIARFEPGDSELNQRHTTKK